MSVAEVRAEPESVRGPHRGAALAPRAGRPGQQPQPVRPALRGDHSGRAGHAHRPPAARRHHARGAGPAHQLLLQVSRLAAPDVCSACLVPGLTARCRRSTRIPRPVPEVDTDPRPVPEVNTDPPACSEVNMDPRPVPEVNTDPPYCPGGRHGSSSCPGSGHKSPVLSRRSTMMHIFISVSVVSLADCRPNTNADFGIPKCWE